jgi:hypothetical protein
MKSLVGILIVAALSAVVYKLYLTKAIPTETKTPQQTISVVGVKNDLLAIAQAERAYQAEHGYYTSLDELVSSGAMVMKKSGRDGYAYEVQTSPGNFQATARCTPTPELPCTNYSIDSSMEVQPLP